MSAKLVMFTHAGERRDFRVRSKRTTIGRNSECDIQVKLGIVSRRHCELTVADGKIRVRDLGSSNGTYVNNRRVQEAEMGPGETLTIGPVIFTLVIDNKPADIKPVRTIVEGRKKKESPPAEASPAPVEVAAKSDTTGSFDLDDSGSIDLVEEKEEKDDGGSVNSELEELSKQHNKLNP